MIYKYKKKYNNKINKIKARINFINNNNNNSNNSVYLKTINIFIL